MTRHSCLIAAVLALSSSAFADTPDGPRPPPIGAIIRELYEKGDFEGVRRELLEAYALVPSPQILFALGQVELQLGNYQVAIDYYEKFIATSPSDEQAALAQQGIGAARIKLAEPDPDERETDIRVPPETPRVSPRRWYMEDTGLVALGTAAVAVGAGLLYYSHRLGNDDSGSLADFDSRLELARTTRWTGIGVAAGGALLIGVTVLRWRLRPDGSAVTVAASPQGATLVISRGW